MHQEEKWLLEEKYGGTENDAFRADCERLRAGEPLAYVIGHSPFLGLKISLETKPLIPRPETEYWVEKAIEGIKKVGAIRVLDLCSGSGAIGLAVSKHCPDTQVTLSDITSDHNSAIERTIKINKLDKSRIEIVTGNLFENVRGGSFDFILTNPPYIDPALDRAEVSVKMHEPHLALYGGKNGLEIIHNIIEASVDHLNPQGQLWIEHEPEQVATIHESAVAKGFTAVTYPDQYGVDRFSVL